MRYVVLFFILTAVIYPQNEIVGSAGSINISSDEFRDRFDFMPHLNYSSDKTDSVKKEFLYSLIAEKLWSIEASSLGYDTIETLRYSLSALKKLFIKDELYKKEILPRLIISNDEIEKAMNYAGRDIYFNFLVTQDSVEATGLYNQIRSGGSFDSLLLSRPEWGLQAKPRLLQYGKTEDENAEEILFNLPAGKISEPVKSHGGWFIFKVVRESLTPDLRSAEQRKNYAYSVLKERKEKAAAGKYLDSVLWGMRITADKMLFDVLSETIAKDLKGRKDSSITLTETDILEVKNNLSNIDLGKTYITVGDENLTLKDFLYWLIFQKVEIKKSDIGEIKSVLYSAGRNFIEDELLVLKGKEEGLDKLNSVEKDLGTWRDYYLSEIIMQKYADSVKIYDSETNSFLKTKHNIDVEQVNIIEILVKDPGKIGIILDELKKGKDFGYLAGIYNEREWTKTTGGEWGYFSAAGNQLGEAAIKMKPGEIYGPIKLPEGYSIFKLLDKRKTKAAMNTEDSLSVKPEIIKAQIFLSKLNKLLNDRTVAFAEKYVVNVNKDLLMRTEVSPLNTYTYRLIGFGGRIAAFPVTIPLYEWFDKYVKKENIP